MNKKNTNYYYIASPGWSEKDKEDLKFIEETLESQHMDYFSPFKHGGMLKLHEDAERSKVSVKVMFDENVSQLRQATDIIVRTEGWDKGTFFELGLFLGNHSFSNVLLVGNNSEDASKIAWESYQIAKKLMNDACNQHKDFVVIDITEKSIDKYIILGFMYAVGVDVVTCSEGPLNSNIMTACSCVLHIDLHPFGGANANKLREYTSLSDLIKDCPGQVMNLSAFKCAKSMK